MAQLSEWRIPSSKGYGEIKFDAQILHDGTSLIEFRVELTGKHWYRHSLEIEPPEYSEIVDDFTIVLSQVLIPLSACEKLRADFDSWLASFAPFACTLCSRTDQELTIQVGPRDGYEATRDHPILACSYAGGCGVEVSFAIDQSCVRIARNELVSVLKFVGNQ